MPDVELPLTPPAAATVPVTPTPATGPAPALTPREHAAARSDFSLATYRQASQPVPEAPTPAPASPVAPATPATPVTAPTRDAQGRFVAPAAEPAASVSATPAATEPEDDETKSPQTISHFEKRLAKERWKRGELERQATADRQRLETELAALKARMPAPPETPPVAPPRPTFPSYEDYLVQHPDTPYDDYVDARAEFRIDQRLTADRQRLAAESAGHAAARALHQIETLGAQAHADFQAVIDAAFAAGDRWAPHVTEFILRQTHPPEAVALTYALAKDRALAARINRLPPARAVYELGQLMRLPSTAAAPSGPAPSVPVTQAPEPFTPVGPSGAASTPSLASAVQGTEISLKRLRALRSR